MTHRHILGNLGERLASNFLKGKGYTILETNWRWKNAEIDLIAQFQGILIFVEVKLRSTDQFGHPAHGLSSAQESRISDAANAYMLEMGYEGEIRFDLITLLDDNLHKKWDIEHFEDYFFPGLQ